MRVLAIGAHPDDIEIACSGTLAKCVKRGDTVIVCHVSTGNLGHVIIPPDELTLIRAALPGAECPLDHEGVFLTGELTRKALNAIIEPLQPINVFRLLD